MWVYILANRKHGALYVGVTSDLVRRFHEHRTGAIPGYTVRYGIKTLVYFECHDQPADAILREKRLKRWRREWKDSLIAETNPGWRDRYDEICL